MNGTLMSLVIVEGVLTVLVAGMFAYRAMLDMKEEDHIVLDQAESHLAREQDAIRRKATMLTKYLTVSSIAWGVLLLLTGGVWVAQSLNMI